MSVSSNIRFHVIAERRKGPKSPPVRGRILEQVRPCWLQIAGVVLLSLLAAPPGLVLPLPLKIVVDNIVTGKPAIAHRLSTLRDCDLLLRVENGGVRVEPGGRQEFRASEMADEIEVPPLHATLPLTTSH